MGSSLCAQRVFHREFHHEHADAGADVDVEMRRMCSEVGMVTLVLEVHLQALLQDCGGRD